MDKFQALLLMFLPSFLKVWVLSKLGFQVHRTSYIGFSFLNVSKIELEENTYIGHGNIFKGLKKLVMKKGSRINRWNFFTGSLKFDSSLIMGNSSSISMRHYFDLCDFINVGDNTIIAGVRSTFFTHSKGVDVIDYVKPINIGEWCYIGSNSCFVPGSSVGSNCFVGMGSVVAGDMSNHTYALLVGNPAKLKKNISKSCVYYLQKQIIHPHLIR